VKTLKLRIKDKHASALVALAREVNQVWNCVNALSMRSIRERQKWLSGYDSEKYTAGFSKCDGVTVGRQTVQLVCEAYATRRKQLKTMRLNWRVSHPKSPKRSLGWIPFKKGGAVYRSGPVKFAGLKLGLWDSYGLGPYALRAGSISHDARGRWYLNVAVEVEAKPGSGTASIGIDLGLKTMATCLDGQSKTTMAKSTHDAGWSMFKTMLEQKCHQASVVFEVVNESYSTQTCSQCASIEGPKGLKALGIRDWTCSCGAVHSRDVNAARNLLRAGLRTLEVGASA